MADDYSLDIVNRTTNGTNCHGDICVEATLYRKILGTIIFLIIWPFIVLDIKWLPIGRPAAALLGASFMVLFGVTPQDQVYGILGEKGNLQTLCLLVGMMLLSYYYDREGMLQVIALWIFGKNKPFKDILWKVCVLSAVLSAIITNDATCLVITPLILNEHTKQQRSKKEYAPLLIGIATSANIGSAATFFGNPQNAFIAAHSQGQVSLLIFFATNLPAAIIGMFLSIGILYLLYFRTTFPKDPPPVLDSTPEMQRNNGGPAFFSADQPPVPNGFAYQGSREMLAESREEMALSYDRSDNPYLTSRIAQERENTYANRSDTQHQNQGFVPNLETSLNDAETSDQINLVPSQEYGEYGSTHNHNLLVSSHDHIHNHVLSGRISRMSARSRNVLSYSTQIGRASIRRQVPEIRIVSPEGEVAQDEHEQHLVDGVEDDSEKKSTWRKKAFVGWLIMITAILVILLAIPPPPTVPVEFNLGLVPMMAGILTMLVDTVINWKYAFDAMMKVDWTVILLFMGLFVWLGGFENTLFPSITFEWLRTYMDLYTVQGVIIFTLFVVIGSNILSNVPLVILIVDELFLFHCGGDNYCTGQLVGVLLAWMSTIAGNFTLIGSIANLIVAEKARNVTGYRLTFWEYLKFGFCSTTVVLFVGLPIVYFAGDGIHVSR